MPYEHFSFERIEFEEFILYTGIRIVLIDATNRTMDRPYAGAFCFFFCPVASIFLRFGCIFIAFEFFYTWQGVRRLRAAREKIKTI